MVNFKKIQSNVKTEATVSTEPAKLAVDKSAAGEGKFDGTYTDNIADGGTNPRAEDSKPAPIPGDEAIQTKADDTSVDKKEGEYDGKYQKADDNEPDGDECECDMCKGSGKMKKSKNPDTNKKFKNEEDVDTAKDPVKVEPIAPVKDDDADEKAPISAGAYDGKYQKGNSILDTIMGRTPIVHQESKLQTMFVIAQNESFAKFKEMTSAVPLKK